MNTTVNGDSNYKDWIIMDCYQGSDVGGSVAFGVNRQKLGAYIMRSAAERSSWSESAELLHTSNYTDYTVTKTGSGASGTWGINVTGSAGSVAWGNVSGRPSSMPASDVYSWAKASSKPSYSKSEVGLGNVDNTADSAKSVKYATSAGSAGSAGSATKATQDSAGQQINKTYIKSLSVSGRTITYTRGDNTTGTITTQDTDTNTWRGIQNNLTSTSTDQSLSAAQGKILNEKFGSYTPKSSKVSTTLNAASWSGSGPYTITVSVSGVTTSNNVEVLIPGSATNAQVEAWMAAGIVNGTQGTNSITLKAYGDKPSINIPIECIIRKDI